MEYCALECFRKMKKRVKEKKVAIAKLIPLVALIEP